MLTDFTGADRVYIACGYTDLRRWIDGLAVLFQQQFNLDDIRKHFGRVVNITSGVRCQLRNSELPGSASNSLHMRGKASDFGVDGVYASTVLEYAWTLPDVDEAYAIDDFHVHIGVLKYS